MQKFIDGNQHLELTPGNLLGVRTADKLVVSHGSEPVTVYLLHSI